MPPHLVREKPPSVVWVEVTIWNHLREPEPFLSEGNLLLFVLDECHIVCYFCFVVSLFVAAFLQGKFLILFCLSGFKFGIVPLLVFVFVINNRRFVLGLSV